MSKISKSRVVGILLLKLSLIIITIWTDLLNIHKKRDTHNGNNRTNRKIRYTAFFPDFISIKNCSNSQNLKIF